MRSRTKSILVVEDHNDLLGIITIIISQQGWSVVGAHNGQDALGIFEAGKFSLALVDVDLKNEMDGIEVAKRLLHLEPSLRIVMMSGTREDNQRLKEAKVGEFLSKPFEPPKLIALLQSVS